MLRYGMPMTEKIVDIRVSPRNTKKYMAIISNPKTNKDRKIHFGARDYQQFRDSTPLKKYKHKNHLDLVRKRRYYSRFSGVETKSAAIRKEISKSKGTYNAKILSHIYLW